VANTNGQSYAGEQSMGHVVRTGGLAGAHDRVLRLWDVRTGACVHQLEGHPVSLPQVAFTADGRNIVSTGLRPALRLRELDRDDDFTVGTGAG
jgi:WD40 repeat protein